MALVIVVGVVSRLPRHPARARSGAVEAGPGTLRDQLRIVAGARDFRLLLTTFVVQALATGCMLAGVDYMADRRARPQGRDHRAVRLLRRPGAAAHAGVGGPRRADRQEAGLPGRRRVVLAAGALLAVLARSAPFGLVVAAVALVGVGYAGCQVFPLAMLPDAAAVDARRTGSSRVGVYTGVWTAGETLGLALGPGLFALVLAARRLPLEHRRRRRPAGLGADRDHARLLACCRPPLILVSLSGWCATRSAPTRSTSCAGVASPDGMSDALARLKALQAADLPVHGGRTLAYVYDSGLAGRRPDRPRGGRGVRRLQRARPDGVPEPAADGERPGRLRARPARRTRHRGRHRDLGRHRVGAARGAGGARRAPGRGRAPHGAAGDRARGVPQGRALLRRGAGAGAGRRRLHRRRRGDRGGRRRGPRPDGAGGRERAVVRARRRRPGHRARGRWRRRAGSGATSTRASAAGCCRTPRGSAEPVPPWTFAVEGVTSISVDLHKYAYAPKGTSLLLHRTPELRRPQFFASAAWPGYTMLNSTMQSTKSGGPLAGAWAVVESLGDTGYLSSFRDEVFEAVDAIVAGTADIPGVDVLVHPQSTLVALVTDGSCDAFTVCDEMATRGWYVQPQMSYAGTPPTIHLSVSAATGAHVDEFLDALCARRSRPRRRPDRSRSTPTWSPSSRPSTRTRSPTPTSTACSPPPGWSAAGDDGEPRAARPDGRGQRAARRRRPRDARGAAGRVPRPAVPAEPVKELRRLEMVEELHRRGLQRLRITPSIAPSGLYWRLSVHAESCDDIDRWTSGNPDDGLDADQLADRFVAEHPALAEAGRGADPAYAAWVSPRRDPGAARPAGLLLRRLGDRRHRGRPAVTGPDEGRPVLEEPPGGR